jgi:hypothetical protein
MFSVSRLAVAVAPVFFYSSNYLAAQPASPFACNRTLTANVVAFDQVITLNRLGSQIPGGMIYALARDVVSTDTPSVSCAAGGCKPGQVHLRDDRRPRPIVLRLGAGDCLSVSLTNLVTPSPTPDNLQISTNAQVGTLWGQTRTRAVGFHVAGLDLLPGGPPPPTNPPCNPSLTSDANWVGTNCSSLANPGETKTYKYYGREEGVYLVYSSDDGLNGNPGQQEAGLFGSVVVEPRNAEFFRSQVTRTDYEEAAFTACPDAPQPATPGCVPKNSFSNPDFGNPMMLTQDPVRKDRWILTTRTRQGGQTATSQVTISQNRQILTLDGHTLPNYYALYQNNNGANQPVNTPILSLLQRTGDAGWEIVHSDLTAIITGPDAGRFPDSQDSPLFNQNPALPDRREPFREFTIHYHVSNAVVQPFEEFSEGPLKDVLAPGADGFGINYGMAAIGPEVFSNRLGVGPSAPCVECKFEEFFLSSWAVGDPAMVVDYPSGGSGRTGAVKKIMQGTHEPGSSSQALNFEERMQVSADVPADTSTPQKSPTKATRAFYPDDPSNVYHSYMRDHVKFRISNVSIGQPHVHHQHAHQWLQTPNSDNTAYLDSQMIIPGSTYTLEMVYNGSGNRNQTVGDSIFHCHFYPHFAAGMWSLWRVHDVFEEGTQLVARTNSRWPAVDPAPAFNRALPDGEISTGTPIPAIVPLPTLGMAPIPAKVKLVDGGTRAYVAPESNGGYSNPGFPFFVPGVAGHRPPHPPMDFAWEESQPGVPVIENGKKKYLDGGLPRHLILGGDVVREFHTRWDFTKDNVIRDAKGNWVAGNLKAYVLPEEGTDVERAAMRAHSHRSIESPQPDGQPGSFVLNGLPPAPGAPFARPDIDDNGNAVTKTRRYQAAVLQTDVVLNKDGWHYPQQRFLTLWDDVFPTLTSQRPPEPLFFRANSGETVEYWHTNLVPGYYELDDFQVRTPTDIIGQHIHLVKFDVLASDGAANGFNYEDGTFSPDEVSDRIAAIDHDGGLMEGLPKNGDYPGVEACLNSAGPLLPCLSKLKRDGKLAPRPAPLVFYCKNPAARDDQDPSCDKKLEAQFLGAQTTIQLWETDPLLNNRGVDRTLRTVFTHDHFGPSTHQNVGLYAGLLVEPPGSSWSDPLTGAPMGGRSDGGPTSFQANITLPNTEESYREFALEFQDLQLAYTAQSISQRTTPSTALFTQRVATQQDFTNDVSALNAGAAVPAPIAGMFKNNGITLSAKAKPSKTNCQFEWCITDPAYPQQTFGLKSDASAINFSAFTPDLSPAWADPKNALGVPPADTYPSNAGLPPFPGLIDSSPAVGTYSMNYRNEPLPLRVAGNSGGNQTDMAWAFASLGNRNDPNLNVQPETRCGTPPCPINQPGGFTFPATPLLCTSGTSNPMTGPDPYTPLLRAYENDRVQIRTLVGAHVSTHPFMLHGLNWLYEPEYGNSGYKSLQGMGLSEHFELNFRMPAPVKLPGATYSDYLYAPSSGITGIQMGMWGLLRAYDGTHGVLPDLKPLVNNPQGHAANANIGTCPQGPNVNTRSYTVIATTPAFLGLSGIIYNQPASSQHASPLTAPNALLYVNKDDLDNQNHLKSGVNVEPLILRANAGDCIQVTLVNEIPANAQPAKVGLSAVFGGASVNPSHMAGLHAPEVAYNIRMADGTNVGYNQLQQPGATSEAVLPAVAAGQGSQISMQWYAGNIDQNGTPTPVEFGVIPLLPADPISQAANGLVGALVIEPAGYSWQPDSGTQASANILDGNGKFAFREFVTVLQEGLVGISGSVTPGTTAVGISTSGGVNYRSEPASLREPPSSLGFTISGTTPSFAQLVQDLDKCSDVNFAFANPKCLSQSSLQAQFQHPTGSADTYTLIPASTVVNQFGTWQITDGSTVYTVTSGNNQLTLSQGTTNLGSVPATFDIIQALDSVAPRLPNLQPLFNLAKPPISSSASVALNGPRGWGVTDGLYSFKVCANITDNFGGCLPLNSTIASLVVFGAINSSTNSTLRDVSHFYTNQLNGQDPQTPVYCAEAGQQVRVRMVQPGGDGDLMMEIHGHSWPQEPYTHHGLGIGDNAESQRLGTQVISANDKLDLVIGHAGGVAGLPGDYLYHAFMDQVDGVWGILRVLPKGTAPSSSTCSASAIQALR